MNRIIRAAVVAAFAAVVGACSDPNALANATVSNEVDDVTLWSLSQGPLTLPSAYSINSRAGVRTQDAANNFEFVFDITPAGAPVFIPTDLLGLLGSGAVKPGLRRPGATTTFDQMTRAPSNGYIVADTIPVVVGDRFYLRTTVSTCTVLGVPLYGKMEVMAVDLTAHTVTLKVLADQNCGYRSLNPGIPKS